MSNCHSELVIHIASLTFEAPIVNKFFVCLKFGYFHQHTKLLSSDLSSKVVPINDTFHIKLQNVDTSADGKERKETIHFKLSISHDNRKEAKEINWNQEFVVIKTSSITTYHKILATKGIGNIQIEYTISQKISTSQFPNNDWVPLARLSLQKSKSSSILLTKNSFYESFFETHFPERIVHSPALVVQLIKTYEDRKDLNMLLDELNRGADGPIEYKIYTLISGLNLLGNLSTRKIMSKYDIELVKLCLLSIFKRTCEEFVYLKEGQFRKMKKLEFGQLMCKWLVDSIGVGKVCQQVYTSLLFSFACTVGKPNVSNLCSVFNITEKKYLDIIPFLPNDEILVYERIGQLLFSI